jgi:hypothetical protein
MNMKKCYLKIVSGTALAVMFLFASCHSAYEVTKAEGRMQPIDSTYDVAPDAEAMALLAPYKAKIDSMMYRVVGTAEMSMDKGAPESLLSNLVADVLRGAAAQVLGTCRYGACEYGWIAERADGRPHYLRQHLRNTAVRELTLCRDFERCLSEATV